LTLAVVHEAQQHTKNAINCGQAETISQIADFVEGIDAQFNRFLNFVLSTTATSPSTRTATASDVIYTPPLPGVVLGHVHVSASIGLSRQSCI
jgi:hypothetical protein